MWHGTAAEALLPVRTEDGRPGAVLTIFTDPFKVKSPIWVHIFGYLNLYIHILVIYTKIVTSSLGPSFCALALVQRFRID
jgi:hypothetical protein